MNAADFGDLLLHNLTLFTENPEILATYQRRFRYLLVDEYQDTNVAQYLWLRLLAQGHRNLCCVGDDDQSIYSWRGAEIGNILRFESDFPGALIVRLEENYRSTPEILAAAGGVIAHNRGRLGKTLWTRAGEGDKVVGARHLGRRAGGALGRRRDRGIAAQGPRAAGDRDPGARRVSDPRVRGALYRARPALSGDRRAALLRAPGNPRRAGLSAAGPPAGATTSPSSASSTRRAAASAPRHCSNCMRRRGPASMPLVEAARMLVTGDKLPRAARNALGAFLVPFDRWRAEAERVTHTDLAQIVLDESGYTGDVAGRQIARRAGPAGKPQGAGRRDGRVREPHRVSRTYQPRHGQRRRNRRRHGQPDDPAQRQGARIRHGVPAGLGGRRVPEPALGRGSAG